MWFHGIVCMVGCFGESWLSVQLLRGGKHEHSTLQQFGSNLACIAPLLVIGDRGVHSHH